MQILSVIFSQKVVDVHDSHSVLKLVKVFGLVESNLHNLCEVSQNFMKLSV